MKAKGVSSIRHSLNTRRVRSVSDIKGASNIKGVNDIRGMDSSRTGAGRVGLGRKQEQLKRNLEQLQKNVSSVRANVQASINAAHEALGAETQKANENLKKARENVQHFPETLQKKLIQRALQIGARRVTRKAGRRLRKLGGLPATVERKLIRRALQIGATRIIKKTGQDLKKAEHLPEILHPGINAAEEALGEEAQKVGQDLKKPEEKAEPFLNPIQHTLQTGVSAVQDVLGKGTQKVGKGPKKTREKEVSGATSQSRERTGTLLTEQGNQKQAGIALFKAGKMLQKKFKKKEVSPKMQEQYTLVRHLFEQSLAIDEELQDKNSMAAKLETLADVTLREGDYGAADQYLERAVHILTEEGNQKQASAALFNAGKRIYEELKQQNQIPDRQERFQQVRHYFEQGLSIDEGLQDKSGVTSILEALVDVTITQKDYEAANQYLERAVHTLTEEGNKKQASTMLFNAGKRIYEQLEEQESADKGKDEGQSGQEGKGETEDKSKDENNNGQ
jgi:tetratricopeptide (TPR) repeat protein